MPQDESSPAAANCSLAYNELGNHSWIIDSRATDHMTLDPQDFAETTQPKRTHHQCKWCEISSYRGWNSGTLILSFFTKYSACACSFKSIVIGRTSYRRIELLCTNLSYILLVSRYSHQGDYWSWH